MGNEFVKTSLSRAGWRPAIWAAEAGICRTSVFALIRAGKVESVLVGARRIITTPPGEFLARVASGAEAA